MLLFFAVGGSSSIWYLVLYIALILPGIIWLLNLGIFALTMSNRKVNGILFWSIILINILLSFISLIPVLEDLQSSQHDDFSDYGLVLILLVLIPLICAFCAIGVRNKIIKV